MLQNLPSSALPNSPGLTSPQRFMPSTTFGTSHSMESSQMTGTGTAVPPHPGVLPHPPPPPHHIHHHLHPHHIPPPESLKPRFLFRMPRVVPNQKEKFESDDLMKRHSREGEVRFTGFRDRPLLERQSKFIQSLREGHTEIAFIATGFNLILSFDTFSHGYHPPERRQIDFEKEPGKVYFRSPMVLNGVCTLWKGYLDMERLDGVGHIEFDEETAKVEDAILREQVEAYNRRMKEFEESRKQQQRHLAAIMGQHQAAMAAAAAAAAAAAGTISTTTTISTTSPPPKTSSPSSSVSQTSLVGEKLSDSNVQVKKEKMSRGTDEEEND